MTKRKKISYLRKIKGRKRRIRITYFRRKPVLKPIAEYITPQTEISKTGLRKHLKGRKRVFKRLKGKSKVDIHLKVVDSKGRINKDLKGLKGLVLPRRRADWQKTIGDYIHTQLLEYNIYFGRYFTPKVIKQLKIKKARSVKVSLKFSKI